MQLFHLEARLGFIAALKQRFAWSVLWKNCLLLADQRPIGSPHKTLGILSAEMKAGLTTGY